MELPILFEDNDIVAINKPAGLVVHADAKTTEPSVVDWVLEKYPENKEVGEPLTLSNGKVIFRPGIVHRIDRETSGVLLIGKNQKAFEHLKSQFQNREVSKVYNTFIYGELNKEEGVINKAIGRSKRDFRQWTTEGRARGELREAVTEYKVLEKGKGFSFVEVRPKTGRTHQIRVHFKYLNFPVVADALYAPKREPALGFTRLALHAKSLDFTDLSGQRVHVEAPLPEDFEQALRLLKA